MSKIFLIFLFFSVFLLSCDDSSSSPSKDADFADNDSDITVEDDDLTVESEPDADEDSSFPDTETAVIDMGEQIVSTHPLIFKETLYVLGYLSKNETHKVDFGGEVVDYPVVNKELYLNAYDVETYEKKWSVKVGDYALDLQKNLVTTGDYIVVVSSYIEKIWIDADSKSKRKISYINYRTGETVYESDDVSSWTFINNKGKLVTKTTSNENSRGKIVSEDGLVLFGEAGFAVSSCSGKIAFTDLRAHFKLTTKDDSIVMMNGILYLPDTLSASDTNITDFLAVRISSAISKLKGYETESILYKIPFETSGNYVAVSPFAIYNEKIYFTYQKKDLTYYLGVYNQFTGELIKEINLAEGKTLSKLSYGITFKPVIADGKIIVTNGELTLGEERYVVLDIETFEKISEIIPSLYDVYIKPLYLGDKSLRVLTECVENCDSDYESEKIYSNYIERFAYSNGSINKTYYKTIPSIPSVVNSYWNAYNGNIFFTETSVEEGNVYHSQIFIIKDSFTGAKLQMDYNNNGNNLVNTEDPSSNTSCSSVIPSDTGSEDFNNQVNIEEASGNAQDVSQDTLPGNTVVYSDIIDLNDAKYAYIPLLKKVFFSTNGETKGTGEGGIKILSQFSCLGGSDCSCHDSKYTAKLFYPYKVYAPLHEKKIEGEEKYLTYFPDIPMYYQIFDEVRLASNRKMLLSYNAYEHDTEDLVDKIENNAGDIFGIAAALFTGDYCSLVENMLSIAENELQPVDENYGSPFITFEKEKETETNVFGIRTGEIKADYHIEASDSPGTMEAVVGTMHNVADAACSVVDIVQNPANPTSYSDLANASGSLMKEKSGRYTEGDIEINKKMLLPLKHLTVKIDKIDLIEPAGYPINTAFARVGIMGQDYVETLFENNADTDRTPFIAYMKNSGLNINSSLEEIIFDSDFDLNEGTAGVYVEIGVEYANPSEFKFVNGGAYSQTFFLEDILYGSWLKDSNSNTFRKNVVKRINSVESDTFVYLTLEAEF